MHQPARRRPEFEEARVYEYPTHLRDGLGDLPTTPGVYVFHGEDGDLPLYIGKSVNLRHRVLSHLRNPDEVNLLRQTRRISHIRTTGEIGALLLEARMIKQQQPLLNQKLRRNRQLCSLRIVAGIPEVVYSNDLNFATEPNLYGLFPSRHAALEALRDLADQHRLCYGALGLEKLKAGRACFRATLEPMCRRLPGDESPEDHQHPPVSPAWKPCASPAGPIPAPSDWSSASRRSARFTSSATGATWAAPPPRSPPASSMPW